MGRDGCPRALDLRGVVGRDDRRAVASTVRHRARWSRWSAWLAGLPGPVRCCYEAGPTGFGLYRAAVAAGIDCQVIAPSKTPRPSGDRNKSDRRDTDLLLRQLMAGALTPVAVPSATFEAARDLARAREQVRVDLMRCRHRLSKLLLRHGRVWDRTAWTQGAPRVAGARRRFEHQNTELAFIDNLAACDGLTARKRGARRAALVGRDRPGVLAAGPPAARVPRDRHALGADHRARGRRLHPVPARGAARIVARAGALARAVRRVRSCTGRSPRPARSTPGGSSSRPPGITPARRGSAGRSTSARKGCPTTSCRSHARAQHRLYRIHKRMRERKQARQRDHRRVRARARLLPLGRRDRPIAQTDSPSPLGWGGAGPRSPLARAKLLWAALTRPRPFLDTRQPATQPGTWGSQPPHMRLTDVENFARRLPTRATRLTNPRTTAPRGTFNAAHLTDAPPYE